MWDLPRPGLELVSPAPAGRLSTTVPPGKPEASFIVRLQLPLCGEREATIVAPPPMYDSAVVPCFHGSPVFLHRHSLLCIFPSCPLSLYPHSQQQFSLQACSPVPMHKLPAPLHTCEHTSQSGAHRAVVRTICLFLTVSHLPPIGCFTLFQQPQMLPFYPNQFLSLSERGFPQIWESLLCFSSPTWGAGSILLPLLLLLPSFFHPTQLCKDLYSPFWCPRSSASFQLVFCENCCIY